MDRKREEDPMNIKCLISLLKTVWSLWIWIMEVKRRDSLTFEMQTIEMKKTKFWWHIFCCKDRHSWASSKSDSKHVNKKANWKLNNSLSMSMIFKCPSNRIRSTPKGIIVNFRLFFEHFITCSWCSLLSSPDFKRIMSIRKRRCFHRIKLTQNALSILLQNSFSGLTTSIIEVFFSREAEKKELNDYYFRLFHQHHIWIYVNFVLQLVFSYGELYKNLLMIIIIWIWWWIFNAFWSIGAERKKYILVKLPHSVEAWTRHIRSNAMENIGELISDLFHQF